MPQCLNIFYSDLFHSNDRLHPDNDLHLFASQRDGLSTSPVFLKDSSGVTQVLKSNRLANSPDSFSRQKTERKLKFDFRLSLLCKGRRYGPTN